MDIICPHCRQTLEGDESIVGETVTCPGCNRDFVVPKVVSLGPAPFVRHRVRPSKKNHAGKWLAIGIPLALLLVFGVILVVRYFGTYSQNLSPSRNAESFSARRSLPNPTETEKMAMGRVFYVFVKQDILMSQLAAAGNNDGETAAAQFLAGMGGAEILNEVDTYGCPEDFAKAWTEYAAAVGGLKVIESGYGFMVAAVRQARLQGQYVDMETRTKLSEIEKELPNLRKECEEKTDAFFAICRRYGLDNLQKWSMDAYNKFEGDPDAQLFKSDRKNTE